MPSFEFVVQGPPATVNTRENNAKRYQRWIRTVREAAREPWPTARDATDAEALTVTVTNYYRVTKDRPHPPDVDNVLKPILDGMNQVVYEDDGQVYRVVSDRFDLADPVSSPSPVLAEGLARFAELLHVRVFWDEKE